MANIREWWMSFRVRVLICLIQRGMAKCRPQYIWLTHKTIADSLELLQLSVASSTASDARREVLNGNKSCPIVYACHHISFSGLDRTLRFSARPNNRYEVSFRNCVNENQTIAIFHLSTVHFSSVWRFERSKWRKERHKNGGESGWWNKTCDLIK